MKLSAYIAALHAARARYGDIEVAPDPLEVGGVTLAFGAAAPSPPPPKHKESPPTETARRLAICTSCPERERFAFPGISREMGKCRQCGCVLELKARLFFEQCPLDKWRHC